MHRLMIAATLPLALGLTGAAMAQGEGEPRRSSTASAAGSAGDAQVMMGMKARDLIGRKVVNASGKSLGEVDDIVIDERDHVVYAVIGVGGFLGFGEKAVAVPFEQLRLGAENVILMSERSEDDLEALPAYEKGQWKSLEPDQPLGR